MSATAFDSLYLSGGEDYGFLQDTDVNFHAQYPLGNDFAGTSHSATVSPSELFVDDNGITSAPGSGAFGSLDTPASSYLESPVFGSSVYNTSPLHDGALDDTLDLEPMPSLFPSMEMDQFGQSDVKPAFTSVNPRAAVMQRQDSTGMQRQKSSPGRPPTQAFHSRKRSETCGVTKAAKARKALPDIVVDQEDDKETAKRKKNTAAARKSRQRKMDNAEASQSEIDRLRGIIYALGGDPDAGGDD